MPSFSRATGINSRIYNRPGLSLIIPRDIGTILIKCVRFLSHRVKMSILIVIYFNVGSIFIVLCAYPFIFIVTFLIISRDEMVLCE